MVSWLNSVNNLFDKLDGTVGDSIQNAQGLLDDDPMFIEGISGQSSVDDIIAQRGELLQDDDDDDDVERQTSNQSLTTDNENDDDDDDDEDDYEEEEEEEVILIDEEEELETTTKLKIPSKETFRHNHIQPQQTTTTEKSPTIEDEKSTTTISSTSEVTEEKEDTSPTKKTIFSMKKSSKDDDEVRKLRRLAVKLNGQLELMEREMEAQRKELDRAAKRLETEHLSYKQKSKSLENQFKEELDFCQKQYKDSQNVLKNEYEKQVADLKLAFQQTEQTYQEQGGTLTNDLEEANQLQVELIQKLSTLQEEKLNFQNKADYAETQADSLTKQCNAWKEAHQVAVDREQQIQTQLDQTISHHARQLNQKQARETQLERAIADLNAAYATLQTQLQKEQQINEQLQQHQPSATKTTKYEFQIQELQQELQELQKDHTMEKEKGETLLQELSTLQTQHTGEIKQYQSQLSQLQQKLHTQSPSKASKIITTTDETKNYNEQVQQIQSQLLKEKQSKEHLKGEITTLKKRLRSALQRANTSETALQELQQQQPKVSHRSSHGNEKKKVPSMKKALKWESGRGQLKDWLGSIVDVLDTWSVELGAFLKHQPLARLGFVCYLTSLHMYIFFLLFFHIHSIHSIHGTPAEEGTSHGPHAALQRSYRQIEQSSGQP